MPRSLNHLFTPLAALLTGCLLVSPAHAQVTFAERESNNTKDAANSVNITIPTTAQTTTRITGTTANNTDTEYDYFRINTTTAATGIYANQIQLTNSAGAASTNVIGSLRGLNQSSGAIGTTEVLFQGSQTSGTAQPYGFNQYYSFGSAGQTQSMYYRVSGAGSSTGGSYTATVTSSLVTPTSIGSFAQGAISFDALANVGTSGVGTNTEAYILDSNYNLYYDNVPSSATFGYAANNDSPGTGISGFSLERSFSPGTYYLVVGVSNVATNDAAAPDDSLRNTSVLDFDKVIATNNNFYNGNNGNTRPTDFTVTDYTGKTFTSSGQQVQSLYALNFYRFQVNVAPEPGSLALLTPLLLPGALLARRRFRRA